MPHYPFLQRFNGQADTLNFFRKKVQKSGVETSRMAPRHNDRNKKREET